MSKERERWQWIELYRNKTGEKEIDMLDVAKFALANGMEPPEIRTVEEIVAQQLSVAARMHTKTDPVTGEPYRVNHHIPSSGSQRGLWMNIDDPPTSAKMWVSASKRREHVVGELVQITRDLDHWNRICPDQTPLQIPLDFTFDAVSYTHLTLPTILRV